MKTTTNIYIYVYVYVYKNGNNDGRFGGEKSITTRAKENLHTPYKKNGGWYDIGVGDERRFGCGCGAPQGCAAKYLHIVFASFFFFFFFLFFTG